MPPRKKFASKRISTRQRAKVDKKVREHQRKLRKDDAKNVHKNRKDPGIPSMWPLKESLLQKLKADQEREVAQKVLLTSGSAKLTSLMMEAHAKTERFQSESQRVVEDKRKAAVDNSKKAFFKEFRAVVDKADVILQVLDARDPLGCRVKEVEEMVLNGGSGKRIVLVLNKIDLVPKEALEGWLKVLRREFPTIAFKASTQNQKTNISQAKHEGLTTSECLGADTLVQLLKNYCRSLDIKTAITVGVVGYPNVGKSSLINSLKRSKVCKVGATPGVTTAKQEIHLDKNIKLLDCPGIVFAQGQREDDSLFLRNCLKVEQMEDPVSPVLKIVERCAAEQLMQLYQIPRFRDGQEFLLHVARRQGKLKKGGLPNYEAAAKAVLNDWNQGKIPFYMSPPVVTKAASNAVSIVDAWAPEFDLSGIERMEIDTVLPNVQYNPLPADEDMQEEDDVTPAQMLIGQQTHKRKTGADRDNGYDIELTAEEAGLNPQLNKQRQKALKKAKKEAAKLEAAPEDAEFAMDVDEAYDFAALH